MSREITIRHIDGFQLSISAGDQTLRCDESVQAGGNGSGFDPFELFLSSLAA
jgi:uncharacterized OsmC-like protein